MKNKFILAAGVIVLLLVAAFFYDKYRFAPKLKFDSLLLTDLDGNTVSLHAFGGKKIFINFFATWCGPCLHEFPSLIQAQSILEKENFQFVVISDESILRLKSFQEQTELPMMILHSERSLQENKIVTLPTSYVLNSRKEIVFTKVGIADWASNSILEKLKAIAD